MHTISTTKCVKEFFRRGKDFFDSISHTLNTAHTFVDFLFSFSNIEGNKSTSGTTKYDEQEIINASYRYMSLSKGCGKRAVAIRFRDITKNIGPHINIGPEVTKRFVALKVARDTLLKREK